MSTTSQLAFCLCCCFFCCCGKNNSDESSENYNQVIVPNTSRDTEIVWTPQSNKTEVPQEILDKTTLQFRFAGETDYQQCVLDRASFYLREYPDLSVELAVGANGIISEKNGVTTFCGLRVTVPWCVDQPVKLPFEWTYQQAHLQSGEIAIFNARIGTQLTIYKEWEVDGEINTEAIYPISGVEDDPETAMLVGSTTIFPETIASFDQNIAAWMESSFTQTDQSGKNTIEVLLEMRHDADTDSAASATRETP